MKTITAEQLQQKLEAGEAQHVIDVRELYEVQQGMIEGAIHIPLGDLEYRLSELDERQAYTLICKAGVRSEMAARYLESVGFDVTNVTDGMYGWMGECSIPGKQL